MISKEIQEFNKAINALALELPEAVWNDFHFMWIQLQNHLSPTPGGVTAEEDIINPIGIAKHWKQIAAEKDAEIAEWKEASETNHKQLMELATIASDREAAVGELVEFIKEADKALYLGEDLNNAEILDFYKRVCIVIKEEGKLLIDKYGS